tara:strand:+ start:127 stop:249 length:123 start_codon:yes stop_codon:yes gene_type:complete
VVVEEVYGEILLLKDQVTIEVVVMMANLVVTVVVEVVLLL